MSNDSFVLSEEEKRVILKMRREKKINSEIERYKQLLDKVLSEFLIWNHSHGLGLSFSVFIGDFNVERLLTEDDKAMEIFTLKAMHSDLKRLLNARDELFNEIGDKFAHLCH